jgi:hypothetical protein
MRRNSATHQRSSLRSHRPSASSIIETDHANDVNNWTAAQRFILLKERRIARRHS